MSSNILEIRMQRHEATCLICNKETDCQWGVPVYNGDIVSNDFPDYMWHNGGGGQAVCEECYRKHERGDIETFDRLYVRPGFTGGDGI